MFLARTLTSHSLEEIGGYFGGRDHSTVLHATRTVTHLRDANANFRSTLDAITRLLQQ
jgi:chromosomal replication initiator protein